MAQGWKPRPVRIVAGISGPELVHAGVGFRLANPSLLGFSVGVGPSMGEVWPTINLEHRLYFGESSEKTSEKTWFCRQGITFFTAAESPQQFAFSLTAGRDFGFKNPKNGITIDAGVFYLPESERSSLILIRSLNLWPALRFQFYFLH